MLILSVHQSHQKQSSHCKLMTALLVLSVLLSRRLRMWYQGCMISQEEWIIHLWDRSNKVQKVSKERVRKLTNLILKTIHDSRPTIIINWKIAHLLLQRSATPMNHIKTRILHSRQLRFRIIHSSSLADILLCLRHSHSVVAHLKMQMILKVWMLFQNHSRIMQGSGIAGLSRSGRTKSQN